MRREARTDMVLRVIPVQGYHQRGIDERTFGTNYAASGFEHGFRYYASDRYKACSDIAIPLGWGLEVEIASALASQKALVYCLNNAIEDMFGEGFVKYQNDGSLEPLQRGGSTVEMITQVMTKAFIRNSYTKFKAFWNFMEGINTMPNESCGMHVNISVGNFGRTEETRLANMIKLANWINGNYELACKLVKRNIDTTFYCGEMAQIEDAEQARDLAEWSDHHVSVNWGHVFEDVSTARIEIRLVGPQTSFPCFRNTMETLFWLVHQCKYLTAEEMENPVKLWGGCNQYVFDRLRNFLPIDIEEKIRQKVQREELI